MSVIHSASSAEDSAPPEVDLSLPWWGGHTLRTPLMTASGCAANGRELHRLFDIAQLGALVTKTVMPAPRSGRDTPRMAETSSGMLNSIGLQGPGIDAFVAEDLPWLRSVGARVVVSVAGNDPDGFARTAAAVCGSDSAEAVVGIEVNISCPNVANRGLVFACDPASAAQVVSAVRPYVPEHIPLIAKLSPDVTDLVGIAGSVLGAGADALTLVNTLLGMAIDTTRLRPVLGGVTGGLSGPAILPVAVRAVWQVHAAMRSGLIRSADIIGVGGVRDADDVVQLMAAGARAVQIGTVLFHDPSAPLRVEAELRSAMHRLGMSSVAELVGAAHPSV